MTDDHVQGARRIICGPLVVVTPHGATYRLEHGESITIPYHVPREVIPPEAGGHIIRW